jgi:chemotaxis protein methyltransferase CheR
VEKILSVLDAGEAFSKKTCDLLARACLRQKKLEEALVWNEKTLSADSCNARFHYLRAKILQRQQDLREANVSLRRSLYLDPHFVLANFEMGQLARQQGRFKEALKYFKNVLSLLQYYAPNDVLPESDGLRAQTLQNTVSALMRAKVS